MRRPLKPYHSLRERGSKLRAASRREVRATPTHLSTVTQLYRRGLGDGETIPQVSLSPHPQVVRQRPRV
ncbi:MAG TPA: hypothetical protein VE944_32345 [Nostoc sp.]|uniref:hypothetical protein n=1 Tax=Nostoc sp. TaxID=1180 RepID=UPI002D2A7393|nr:hypothetical protein [Nostoc sp.]HYX18961.1 hypothetical protein [Nostoc sp.]